MALTFRIDGHTGTLADPVADLIAENLRCFVAARYAGDVESVTRSGFVPIWLNSAGATARVMEETLAEPIHLKHGRHAYANALAQALRVTGPARFDATSKHARLLRTLRSARDD